MPGSEELMIANEEMRIRISILEDQLGKLQFALDVAQTDEVIWAQYAAAFIGAGPHNDMSAYQAADRMLENHKQRWPRSQG